MSAELYYRRLGKLFETAIVSEQQDYLGLDIQTFKVITGSRMILYFNVIDCPIGTSINIAVDNGVSIDEDFKEKANETYTAPGIYTIILSDIHIYFNVSISVTGSQGATYSLGCTLADNKDDISGFPDDDGNFSSVQINDGTDTLNINPDGSINVVVTSSGDVETPLNIFNEVAGVLSGVETEVVNYTVPVGKTAQLQRVEFSGENISHYQIYVNAVKIASRRTHHGSGLTDDFEFLGKTGSGAALIAGDIVSLTTLHNRPTTGNFEGRLQILLVG